VAESKQGEIKTTGLIKTGHASLVKEVVAQGSKLRGATRSGMTKEENEQPGLTIMKI